jgi:hypothetical protein
LPQVIYFWASTTAVMTSSPQQITQLLKEWAGGNEAALHQLMPLVYAELHNMARRYMNQQDPPTRYKPPP